MRLFVPLAITSVAVCHGQVVLNDNPMDEIVLSGSGTVELEVQEFSYDTPEGNVMTTRVLRKPGSLYSALPAPILRMSKGHSTTLTLSNALDGYTGTKYATNIHTHGLHISGFVDDITVSVEPGNSHQYTYELPSNHAGGTHWYHSHLHEHTGFQVGGGMAGMIIVEDAQDGSEIPAEVAAMVEHPLLVFEMCPASVVSDAETFGDLGYALSGRRGTCHYIVNGFKDPILQVDANTWTRLRIAHVSESDVTANFSGGDCDALLIARDGVYLTDGPREAVDMAFVQATRADILLRCRSATTLTMGADSVLSIEPIGAAATDSLSVDTLMNGFRPCFPSYLQDLRQLTTVDTTWSISAGARKINGEGWTGQARSESIHDMTLGTVEEWSISANAHPLHAHINHFQAQQDVDAFTKAGDWVDTFLGSADFRVPIDGIVGPVVMHCHILAHEDEGAMTVAWIYDENGSDASDAPDDPWSAGCASQNTLGSVVTTTTAVPPPPTTTTTLPPPPTTTTTVPPPPTTTTSETNCLPSSSTCSSKNECCSRQCRGKSGAKTCN